MPKPKIFISHSAKEERTRKLLDALYVALDNAGFDVLLDKQRLEPGVEWRDELNKWLWQCHGAVILLSEAALNSPWVLKEATNLTWRRDLSRQFDNRLFDALPVLLPPVAVGQLAQTKFSPLAIDAIQTLTADSDEAVIKKIIERLAPLLQRFGELSPFKKVQGALVAILDRVNRDEALDLIAESFKLDTAIFGAGGDKKIHLADHALKAADYGALLDVVKIITPRVGRENAKEFCRIVWPFCWVDQLAASRIPVVMRKPERKRSMALNSRRKETVEMYIRRICEEYPPWVFRELRGVYSAAQIKEMLDDLRAIIKRHLGYEEDDVVSDEELNGDLANDVAERPLVVIVPPPLPDRGVIDKVTATFSQVTYVLLSDQIDSIKFRDLNLADVEFLLPELDQTLESKARRDFNKLSDEIDRIPINAG
jgi:hypothetical protein